ncbi:thiol:disulfide interchange protein DsbA/DsbL [Undibacterium pigrum]|uniref:Thiol:disulfide interchange protein n=1 Tax=Undibacterium pigrum TaxID=401470 RepID=A0A318ITN5_9BURK|nr:thiol:disulfide interchange protein DsbA/DsbL [Undibacterium pigrum]PXX38725.1 thiol:disulfide interchange protein DsbA [Undibacterium pigrum]
MRFLRLLLITLGFVSATALASPASPKEGADFISLKNPQATQATGKKIEVIEFFMYHCPACNMLEPVVNEWVKKQGDNIVFRRIHLPLTGEKDPEAHLFLTLEAMNLEASLHAKVLATWHVERNRLSSDDDNIAWAVKNGIDKAKFLSFYNSFSVISKLKSLGKLVATYQVDSTPTFVVDGRFLTNPSMIGSANASIPREQLGQATMQLLDSLLVKSKK